MALTRRALLGCCTLAIPLLAPAPSLANTARTCMPNRNERLVRRAGHVVLLRHRGRVDQDYFLACWAPTSRRTRLVEVSGLPPDPAAEPDIEIAGRYVASVGLELDGPLEDRVARVTDARSGRTRMLGFDIVGGVPVNGDYVERIRVTAAGQVAYVGDQGRPDGGGTRLLVAGSLRSIPRLEHEPTVVAGHVLAVGPTIEPASLRLRGDAVAWIDAAGSHAAPVPG